MGCGTHETHIDPPAFVQCILHCDVLRFHAFHLNLATATADAKAIAADRSDALYTMHPICLRQTDLSKLQRADVNDRRSINVNNVC